MGGLSGGESILTDPNLPPAFIVHDPADTVAPFAWSANLAAKLAELGVPHDFWQPEGVGHSLRPSTFDHVLPNGKTVLENNMLFLARYLVPEPSTWMLATMAVLGVGLFALRPNPTRHRRGT